MVREITIRIKHNDWKVKFMSRRTFLRKFPEYSDAKAICQTDIREMVFIDEHMFTPFIRHEVFHALVVESADWRDDLTPIEVEECCAGVVQRDFALLMQLTEHIADSYFMSKEKK